MNLIVVGVFLLFINAVAVWSWVIAYVDDSQNSRITRFLALILVVLVITIDGLVWSKKF